MRSEPPIPLSVKIAISGAILFFAKYIAVLLFYQTLVDSYRDIGGKAALGFVGCIGLALGKRIAWRWAQYIAWYLLVASIGVTMIAPELALIDRVIATLLGCLPYATVLVSLRCRSAMEYFDLICPSCGKPTRSGTDITFRRARCKACGAVWRNKGDYVAASLVADASSYHQPQVTVPNEVR